jgi:hypothetical protein
MKGLDKILSPWQRTKLDIFPIFSRRTLLDIDNDQLFFIIKIGKSWKTSIPNETNRYNNDTTAKKIMDEYLVLQGYILTTKEEWEKYSILL